MLELGLPRALVISTLTLAATLAAGSAQAEAPAPPAAAAPTAPAADAADALPPQAKPDSEAVPAATKRPAKPGHVYSPPGYPEPPAGSAPSEETAPQPRSAPRWDGRPPGFELGNGAPPLSYTIPAEKQPTYPQEMQARSTGMMAGGVVLLSFGVVGLFAGSAMVGAHEPIVDQPNTCFDCGFEGDGSSSRSGSDVVLKPGFQTAGIATLIGSVVAIGAAIPLIVIGAKKVPYTDASSPAAQAAKLTPTLRVGPANATVLWQF